MIQHVCQELGFEGLNLAGKCCKELLMQTPEMNTESIHKLGNDQFNVQSTQAARMYLVKLSTQSCDCPDWPRVQLCKHVTAIAHFFRNSDQKIELDIPKTVQVQSNQEGLVGMCSEASATSILENMIAISRALLSDSTLSSLETI